MYMLKCEHVLSWIADYVMSQTKDSKKESNRKHVLSWIADYVMSQTKDSKKESNRNKIIFYTLGTKISKNGKISKGVHNTEREKIKMVKSWL